jgi:hypothetical protein
MHNLLEVILETPTPQERYSLLPNAQIATPGALPRAPQQNIVSSSQAPTSGNLPGVSAPRAIDGGGWDQLANTAATLGLKLAEKMRQRADDAAMAELGAKANQWYADNILNPETGLTSIKGKNALGGFDSISAEWKAFQDTSIAAMPENSRNRASVYLESFRVKVDHASSAHLGSEVARYEDEADVALITSSEAMIINSDDKVGSRNIVDDAIHRRGSRLGWGQEKIAFELSSSRARVHVNKAELLVSTGSWGELGKYLRDNFAEIPPDARETLTAKYTSGSKVSKPYEIVNSAIQQFPIVEELGTWDREKVSKYITMSLASTPEYIPTAINYFNSLNNNRSAIINEKVDSLIQEAVAVYGTSYDINDVITSPSFRKLPVSEQNALKEKITITSEASQEKLQKARAKGLLSYQQERNFSAASVLISRGKTIHDIKVTMGSSDSLNKEQWSQLSEQAILFSKPDVITARDMLGKFMYGSGNWKDGDGAIDSDARGGLIADNLTPQQEEKLLSGLRQYVASGGEEPVKYMDNSLKQFKFSFTPIAANLGIAFGGWVDKTEKEVFAHDTTYGAEAVRIFQPFAEGSSPITDVEEPRYKFESNGVSYTISAGQLKAYRDHQRLGATFTPSTDGTIYVKPSVSPGMEGYRIIINPDGTEKRITVGDFFQGVK